MLIKNARTCTSSIVTINSKQIHLSSSYLHYNNIPITLSLTYTQEWQLKLSGIDVDVDTEETDIDGEEEVGRKPMGAINPLMMERMEGRENSQWSCKLVDLTRIY